MTDASAGPAAFDALASSYDDAFSKSTLGRLLRNRVWRQLDRAFAPGERVLDVGCGTGEDAVHLAERGVHVLATDASPDMIEQARRKADERALSHLVEVRVVAAEAFGRDGPMAVVSQLNETIAVGDWTLYPTARERVQAVTADDVADVAARVFDDDAITVGHYVPTGV